MSDYDRTTQGFYLNFYFHYAAYMFSLLSIRIPGTTTVEDMLIFNQLIVMMSNIMASISSDSSSMAVCLFAEAVAFCGCYSLAFAVYVLPWLLLSMCPR